jgi:hypothetical protein
MNRCTAQVEPFGLARLQADPMGGAVIFNRPVYY